MSNIQIHELDSFSGSPSNTDYLVIDSGENTSKIPSTVFNSVVNAYPITGETPLTSGWLSKTSGGTALTPVTGKIYILMEDSGDYTKNAMFRWDGTAYEPLTSGAGGHMELTQEEYDRVFEIDDAILYHEFVALMDARLSDEEPTLSSTPEFAFTGFEQCEKEFRWLFQRLRSGER